MRGLPLVAVPLSADRERRAALDAITSARAGGLLVLADVLTIARRAELVTFTARHQIPAVYPLPEFVDAGGLEECLPTVRGRPDHGDIWSRPGLSRAERSLVTLAVLTALQHEVELAMHVKAALRNGLTPEQIQEVLLQVAIYAGVPAGNRAFAVAQRVLAEMPAESSAGSPAQPSAGSPAVP